MSLEQLFETIESIAFEVNFTVLSGFKSFLIALTQDAAVQALAGRLKRSAQERAAVEARILALLNASTDRRYLHPQDTALAVYLYALGGTEAEMLRPALVLAAHRGDLWWARNIAAHLLETVTERP